MFGIGSKDGWHWWKGRGRVAACAGVTISGIGCYVLWRDVSSVADRVSLDGKTLQLEANHFPYIYLPTLVSDNVSHTESKDRMPIMKITHPKYCNKGIWFPWLQKYSHDPWTLLHLARCDDPEIRRAGVQALAQHHGWHDAEYLHVAQAADDRTIIALSRSDNVDSRFFLKPPRLPKTEWSLDEDFREILSSLPTSDLDVCTQYFTSNALHLQPQGMVDERGGLWCYGDGSLTHAHTLTSLPAETLEMYCIEALLKHSLVESHCVEMVKLGGLQLLQRLKSAHPQDPKLLQHLAQIIRNLCLYESLHSQIVTSGWVGILVEWLRSADVGLASTAASALANLDTDYIPTHKYVDQIYLCHPQYRSSEPIYADVVFIHGLLGGAFRTWRQKDRKPNPENSIADESEDPYTFCWPKSWLMEDCPNTRLVMVDYDTHLSEWSPKCPFEQEKHSLAARSNELIKKLKAAGIGDRPIIWVGHSMGGLLIKQMLVDAEKQSTNRKILNNTKGIVLYSTPHKGTHLAAYSTTAKLLLNPSVELKELRQGSPMLLDLHQNFCRIVREKNLRLLSLGETERSQIMNIKMLVVPPESSDPGLGEYHGMNVDHLNICKPKNRQSLIYTLTREFISESISSNITV